MPPTTPTTPSFFGHQIALDILRRKSVYGWPPQSGEWIQEKLQNRIEEMRRDGYEREVINRLLLTLSEITINESERFLCNVDRCAFFAELVRLEITE